MGSPFRRQTITNTKSGQTWLCLPALVLNPARRAISPPSWAMCLSAAQRPVLLKPIAQREEGAMSALAMSQNGGLGQPNLV